LGALSNGAVHEKYPLMGMIGRPSVVRFAGVTRLDILRFRPWASAVSATPPITG
jgi:hypothetical protein